MGEENRSPPVPLYRNPGGDNWRYWYVLWYLTAKGSLRRRSWRPFPEAHTFTCSLGLRSHLEWLAWCRTGATPCGIPTNPAEVYERSGWRGWGDWLGTGRAVRHRRILSDRQARYLAELDDELGPLSEEGIDAARRLWHGEQ